MTNYKKGRHMKKNCSSNRTGQSVVCALFMALALAWGIANAESFRGPVTGGQVFYGIRLPDDYESSGKAYPVLYFLHGKGGAWDTFLPAACFLRHAIDSGVLEEVIIITPEGYDDQRWQGLAETNVIQELVPYVEATYRVKPGAPYRLLCGFSMGGHGAWYLGAKYADMWCAVLSLDAAMSGTGTYTPYIQNCLDTDQRFYGIGATLCGARMEPVVAAYRDAGVPVEYAYYPVTHSVETLLRADWVNGWPGVSFLQANIGRGDASPVVPKVVSSPRGARPTVSMPYALYALNGKLVWPMSVHTRANGNPGGKGLANMTLIGRNDARAAHSMLLGQR